MEQTEVKNNEPKTTQPPTPEAVAGAQPEAAQNAEASPEEPGIALVDLSPAEMLFELARGKCILFHTPEKESYAVIERNGHQETWDINGREFGFWLCRVGHEATGRMPSKKAVKEALRLLEGEALINAPLHPVHTRFARVGDAIYWDLANENWEQIRITKDGYQGVQAKDSPVRFIRTQTMAPLPYPSPGEPLTALQDFLNLETQGDLVLIISWLLSAMRPEGPFPILILQGEQGTAKSTTARLLCSIIDPSLLTARSLPRSERDLAISANKVWVLNFDNLSQLDRGLSDAFCRVSTGGGLATRKLYTNDTEMIFRLKRPLILNGISDIATRHDLADRSIIVNLPPIPEEKRRSERDIRKAWNATRPEMMAALCAAIRTALQNIDKVKLDKAPRMADFAEWIIAAESRLPWEPGTFMREYTLNREYVVEVSLEADVVGSAVIQFINGKNEWSGTPTELLKALNMIVPRDIQRRNYWPKRPNTLSNNLRQVAPALRKKGIEIERSKSGKRNITIRRTAKRTDRIDPIVQHGEISMESVGRKTVEKGLSLGEPWVLLSAPPTPARVDDQGGQGVVSGLAVPQRVD